MTPTFQKYLLKLCLHLFLKWTRLSFEAALFVVFFVVQFAAVAMAWELMCSYCIEYYNNFIVT